jgi:hypothetical protein
VRVLAVILICYSALVLLVILAGAIAGLRDRHEDRARAISWCWACGRALQGGHCRTCDDRARDHPAMDRTMHSVRREDWLEATDAIQDDEPLPAWKGVEQRDREEARERTILDRRRQELAHWCPKAQRAPDHPADREWAARSLWASTGNPQMVDEP